MPRAPCGSASWSASHGRLESALRHGRDGQAAGRRPSSITRVGVRDRQGDRLLDEDVLAMSDRRQRLGAWRPGRGHDRDGIDVVTIEQLVESVVHGTPSARPPPGRARADALTTPPRRRPVDRGDRLEVLRGDRAAAHDPDRERLPAGRSSARSGRPWRRRRRRRRGRPSVPIRIGSAKTRTSSAARPARHSGRPRARCHPSRRISSMTAWFRFSGT